MSIANFIPTKDGQKASAVCEWCGKRSRPVARNWRGLPDLWELPRGWWESPYSLDTVHTDGSSGTLYTCPTCGKRRVGLTPHPERQAAIAARAGGVSVQ